MALVKSFCAGLLQNMTVLAVEFERIRRPSCIPSSSFMFSLLKTLSLECRDDIYKRTMARSDFNVKPPHTATALIKMI